MVAAGMAGRYNQGVPRENTKVATGGSTSMKNVIAALTEGFAEVEPGVTVSYDPTGSGAVISAVEANPLAIGYASLSAVGGLFARCCTAPIVKFHFCSKNLSFPCNVSGHWTVL